MLVRDEALDGFSELLDFSVAHRSYDRKAPKGHSGKNRFKVRHDAKESRPASNHIIYDGHCPGDLKTLLPLDAY